MTIICSPTTHLMPPLDTFLSTDNDDDKQHNNDDDLHWNYIPNKNGTPIHGTKLYNLMDASKCTQSNFLVLVDMVINSLSLKRLRPMTQKFLFAFLLNNT